MYKYLLSAAILGAASIGTAHATVITHTFDTKVTDSTSNASGAPTVTFDDAGGTGTVTMTIDLTPLSASEFISDYWFNFADAGTTALTITRTGGTGPTAGWITINPIVADGYNSAGPNGLFDGLISFTTSNAGGGIRRFNFDETLVFTITGTGITAADFDLLGTVGGGGADAQIGQIHIQGLADGGSVHVSPEPEDPPVDVPEPAMLGLFGLGLMGVGMARRRRRG